MINSMALRRQATGWALASGLTLAHVAYGALTAETSLLFDLLWAATLGVLVVRPAWGATKTAVLFWPGVPFALVLTLAVVSTFGRAQPPFESLKPLLMAAAPSIDRSATRLEIVRLLGLACCFGVGFCVGRSTRSAQATLNATVLAGALFTVAAVTLSYAGVLPQSQGSRIEAWFLNPDSAGTVFGVLLCLSAPLSEPRAHPNPGGVPSRWAWAPRLISATLFLALLLTRSRAALVATCTALIVLVVLQALTSHLRLKRLAIVAGAAGLMAAGAFLTGASTLGRFSNLGIDAGLRRYIFYINWTNFLHRPWLGYGLGNFDTVNRATLTPDTFNKLWNIRSAENVYLQWLLEGGFFCAMCMFASIILPILITLRRILEGTNRFRLLSILISADAVFIIHGFFDFALQTPSISLFWSFLLGLQLALASTYSRETVRWRPS